MTWICSVAGRVLWFAFLRVLTLYNTTPGEERRVERVHVGVEDDRVEVPDHDGQRRQNGLVQMNGRRNVQPGFRQETQRQIVGPEQQAGGDHHDGAPNY